MDLEHYGDITLEELLAGPVRKQLWAALDAKDLVSIGHNHPNAIVLTQAKWLGYPEKFQVRNFSGYWNDKKFPESREVWTNRGKVSQINKYAFFVSERSIKSFGMRHRLIGGMVIYHEALI